MTPLAAYLLLSAFVFAIGLAGALTRRNAILVLIDVPSVGGIVRLGRASRSTELQTKPDVKRCKQEPVIVRK